jgi:Spy/CpxP family protein refolding chaperone
VLRKELFKEEPKHLEQKELFEWKQKKEIEERKIRAKLEKAYETEKSKSVIMKKCNRIYHEFLKTIDGKLYSHLMDN